MDRKPNLRDASRYHVVRGGGKAKAAGPAACSGAGPAALAWVELRLVHPVTGERLVCSATLATKFATLLRTGLGGRPPAAAAPLTGSPQHRELPDSVVSKLANYPMSQTVV